MTSSPLSLSPSLSVHFLLHPAAGKRAANQTLFCPPAATAVAQHVSCQKRVRETECSLSLSFALSRDVRRRRSRINLSFFLSPPTRPEMPPIVVVCWPRTHVLGLGLPLCTALSLSLSFPFIRQLFLSCAILVIDQRELFFATCPKRINFFSTYTTHTALDCFV